MKAAFFTVALICVFGFNARASHSPNLDAAINHLQAAKRAQSGTPPVAVNYFGTASPNGADAATPSATPGNPSATQVAEVTSDLQEALDSLNRATNNKGGKRDEAIGLVKDAMALIKTGDMDEANQKIDHAIAELQVVAR
jgi:hypothetical protein